METIFENKFICTKDYYSEYYKYICFKRPLILIIDIIFGIAFIIGILSIIFPKLVILDINTALGNIATLPIIFCLQFYVFFRNKELAYNRDLETNKGNPIEIKLSITENSINILRGSEQAINTELINIEKVVKTIDKTKKV